MKTALLKLMQSRTRDVLHDVIEHLDACGVFLLDFHHVIHRRIGGSYSRDTASGYFLHLGCYPTRFVTEWWVMHEVGHVLWYFYEPLSSSHVQTILLRGRARQRRRPAPQPFLLWPDGHTRRPSVTRRAFTLRRASRWGGALLRVDRPHVCNGWLRSTPTERLKGYVERLLESRLSTNDP